MVANKNHVAEMVDKVEQQLYTISPSLSGGGYTTAAQLYQPFLLHGSY